MGGWVARIGYCDPGPRSQVPEPRSQVPEPSPRTDFQSPMSDDRERAPSLDYELRLRITITSTRDRERASSLESRASITNYDHDYELRLRARGNEPLASSLDDGSRSLSILRFSAMPKPPTRRAGRMLVAPGASPGSVPPTLAKARPARRVECGLELNGDEDAPPAGNLGIRDHPDPLALDHIRPASRGSFIR